MVELDYMEGLLNALCTRSIRNTMQKKKEELASVPLKDWLERLREARVETTIQDVPSVEAFLEKFKVAEDLQEIDAADIRKSNSKIKDILKEIVRPPNNLQLGIAQLATSLVDKHPRQIFVLPCGSGKSRVAATIALLLLGEKTKFKRILMVYVNGALRRKDEEDFQDLFALLPNGSQITYHTGIDFLTPPNSLVVIDEADYFAFKDPYLF